MLEGKGLLAARLRAGWPTRRDRCRPMTPNAGPDHARSFPVVGMVMPIGYLRRRDSHAKALGRSYRRDVAPHARDECIVHIMPFQKPQAQQVHACSQHALPDGHGLQVVCRKEAGAPSAVPLSGLAHSPAPTLTSLAALIITKLCFQKTHLNSQAQKANVWARPWDLRCFEHKPQDLKLTIENNKKKH